MRWEFSSIFYCKLVRDQATLPSRMRLYWVPTDCKVLLQKAYLLPAVGCQFLLQANRWSAPTGKRYSKKKGYVRGYFSLFNRLRIRLNSSLLWNGTTNCPLPDLLTFMATFASKMSVNSLRALFA